jgi:DNA-binding beta-propeller fold protein YncE
MRNRVFVLLLLVWVAAAVASAAPGAPTQKLIYQLSTIAGSGNMGDGGQATLAQIGAIQGIAIDHAGNLYLSDTDNHRIRKIAPNGIITTLAGTGVPGFSGDNGPAASAQLKLPYGLAVDIAGNLYVADLGNNRVRRIVPDGTITTFAATGEKGSAGDGGPAVHAQLMTLRAI